MRDVTKIITNKNKMSVAALVLTRNEEENIKRCLDNIAPYVDEILIIDGNSTDKTVEIASEYTDKIYSREFSGSFAVERNYGIDNLTSEWVLIVDADEVWDKYLLKRLPILTNQEKHDAYSFLRYDIPPDGKILDLEYGYPNINVRLARKDKLRYYGAIHERAIIFGKTKFIPEVIYHYRDHIVDYEGEKAKRFKEISDTAKNRNQGIELSKTFLVVRGLRIIFHYFFDITFGLNLHKRGIKGILLGLQYTLRFAAGGLLKYKRDGQF